MENKTDWEKQLLVSFPFISAIMANQYASISNYLKKHFAPVAPFECSRVIQNAGRAFKTTVRSGDIYDHWLFFPTLTRTNTIPAPCAAENQL